MAFTAQTTVGRHSAQPEINITPLVDVVLVLLIIFMVIAPALNEGEQVLLPEILTPDAKPKDMNPIEVALAASGAVLLSKERIDPNALFPTLKQLHEADTGRHLMLLTDSSIPYKKVRDTMAEIQKIGFKGVSLKVNQRKRRGE